MSGARGGRVVVVTGANGEIGYHLLAALAADGYRVAGLDVEGGDVRALRATHPDRVRYVGCDVTSDEDVETAIQEVLEEWPVSTSSSTTPPSSPSPPSRSRPSPRRGGSSR